MKYSSCKEIDRLIRSLVKAGWEYRHGRKHGKLLSPSADTPLTVPGSPSDRRAFLNFQRDVRHAMRVTSPLVIEAIPSARVTPSPWGAKLPMA